MADKITEIIGQEAFDQVSKLKADLKELQAQFEKSAKVAILLNTALSETKGIEDTSDAIKKQQKNVDTLEKLTAKLAHTQSELGKAEQELKLKIQEATQANKDSIKTDTAKEGSIEEMRLQLKALQKEYDGLAKAEREAATGTQLLSKLQGIDAELKKLEGNTGRFQRNVGNYQQATFQLTQVLREIPAFTYSAQTGIMGISNNLPMLGDAFRKVKAEVGSTSGALKIFGKSLLSFPNIAAVAIGLFTIFADKIFNLGKASEEATEQTKRFNEAHTQMINDIGRGLAELDVLYQTATNPTLDYKKRGEAIDELQKKYPEMFKNADREKLMNGELSESYKILTEQIIKRAEETARLNILNKLIADRVDLEMRLEKLTKQNAKGEFYYSKESAENLKSQIKFKNNEIQVIERKIQASKEDFRNESFFLDENVKAQGKAIAIKQKKYAIEGKQEKQNVKNRIEEISKEYENKQKLLDISLKNNKISEEDYYHKSISLARNYFAERKGLSEKEIDSEIELNDKLTDSIAENTKKLIEYTSLRLKTSNYVYGQAEDAKLAKNKKTNDEIVKDAEKTAKILKLIQDDIAEHNKKLLQIEAERLQANDTLRTSSLSATEITSNTITDRIAWNVNQRYERELKYIDEREKAEMESLERMTLSDKERAEKKKKIEIEAEQRRKTIEREKIRDLRRLAILQKNIDIGTIIANTAIAVTQALTDKTVISPYLRIANAVAMGLQGAAQLTKVIATPLPQYAEGTDGTPSDSHAIVGERGPELVEEPGGKKWLTPSKPTIVYLKKGTKVTSHEELMDSVYKGAYLKVSSNNSNDNAYKSLVEQFALLYGKFDNMEKAIRESAPKININGNFDHYTRIQQAKKIA